MVFFNIHSAAKLEKKLKGDPLVEKKSKKSRTMPKKMKGGPFGIFQHPFCRKTPEKMKAEPLRNLFCLESRTMSK